MSKPNSYLFSGTLGTKTGYSSITNVVRSRTTELDLTEHPRQAKPLTSKQRRTLRTKIANRTASREDYRQYMSDSRFSERRKTGVNAFWMQERRRLLSGSQPTRNWSQEQKSAILSGGRPKYNGRTIQGHHTYSATRYPHLSNRGEVIFPVTFDEHLYGWHGGNFKTSLPGKPIKYKTIYDFGGRS